MRAASLIMWLLSKSAMNGSAINKAMKIANIFGTKTSVISWIWDDDSDKQTDQQYRARDKNQRHDGVAGNVEHFRTGHGTPPTCSTVKSASA